MKHYLRRSEMTSNVQDNGAAPAKVSFLPHIDAVVGIGASAGGLEAIQEFLDNLPAQTGCAYIVVQHLSPDYPSLLTSLLGKHTPMPVLEAAQGQPLRPNHVYVIPPGKMLRLTSGGTLALDVKSTAKVPASAVDFFFGSIAEAAGNKAVAVVLSGTGSDGTRGLQLVQGAGGFTLVQDPLTARFDGMPTNAIAAGAADLILSPELMPEHLLKHVRPDSAPVEAAVVMAEDRVYVKEALELVHSRTGCDFRSYKAPTIHRRIHKRMAEAHAETLVEYVALLRESEAECRELCREFLIGVTRFFRDPLAFDALQESALMPMVASKPEGGNIKCWVTACSTGEEAYTLAILLSEIIQNEGRTIEFKIFATDIDESAIHFAAKGIYSEASVRTIPAALLEKYFTSCDGGYQVTPELRKRIVFARHSIIKDPAFIKNDLVSCRNLLIYFTDALQRKVLSALHYATNPSGYLFLGPSESVGVLSDNLVEVNHRWKIFQKPATADGAKESLHAVRTGMQQSAPRVYTPRKAARTIADGFRELVADELGVALLHLNLRYEVKEASGIFNRYLTLPADRFDTNVLRMLVPDLSIAIGQALRTVTKDGGTVRLSRVRVRGEAGEMRYINAVARAMDDNPGILLMLSDSNGETVDDAAASGASMPDRHTTDYLLELEGELKETKEQLQAVVEDLETTNEELQSSNEELLSANEELQSSNEELQSLNEELHTLNTEHQMRIRELQALNEDLDNYFRSVETGQIFVDGAGRVRNFNPAAQRYVNLIGSDIGRPLGHISSNISGLHLEEALPRDGARGTDEHEILLKDGTRHLMRIMPYLRGDGTSDGAVLTFTDVTRIRLLDQIVKGVFEASQSGIMALKAESSREETSVCYTVLALNTAAAQVTGKPIEDLVGQSLQEAFPQFTTDAIQARYSRTLETGAPQLFEQAKGGQEAGWWQLSVAKIEGGLAVTFSDITETRQAEEKLRQNYNSLLQARESLRKANADLESTVLARTQQLSESEERFRLVSQTTAEGIWDWSFTDGTVWWSEGFYALAGRPAEGEDAGMAFKESRIHPDDRCRVRRTIHGAINAGRKTWSAEYRFRRGDDTWADILDRGSIYKDEHNTPIRMLGSMLDVTELRRAEAQASEEEARTRLLADSLPVIAWSTGRDGMADFLNSSFQETFGLPTQQGMGNGWQALLHPDSMQALEAVQRSHGRRGKEFSLEIQLRMPEGQYRWYGLRAAPQKDGKGRLIRWVGSLTDIQTHKSLTQELEQRVRERTIELQESNAELERSNSDLQQFASVASHDLKEPLRKISMFGNMAKSRLSTGDADEKVRDYNARMVDAAERMTRLVNDLLSFSRLSADLTTERTNLNTILAEVLEDLEATVAEKGARVLADELPTLEVVPGQMRQLFQNLLANGLKFTNPGVAPVITIQARRANGPRTDAEEVPDGAWWKLSFSDNGIGFDEEFRERIFTIFQRLHGKEAYEGTGIGLAIARKIVERHGGRIEADGKQGKGATFYVFLPA